MVQVPEAINVAVVPETVQILVVVEEKVTAKPDVAVAESVSGVPTVWVPGVGKLMVCGVRDAPLTVKLCGTIAAAA
jgi:hypothetical protein